MKVIGFSGVDGLGKSFYSNLIKGELEKIGYNVGILHYFEYSLSRFLLNNNLNNEPSKNKGKKTNFFSVNLRYLIYFLDLIYIYIIKIIKKNKLDFLILDRNYLDYKVNINYLKGKENTKFKINYFDFHFLLFTDKEIADRIPRQGQEYFYTKNKMYKNLNHNSSNTFYLNADISKEKNLKSIFKILDVE